MHMGRCPTCVYIERKVYIQPILNTISGSGDELLKYSIVYIECMRFITQKMVAEYIRETWKQ